MSLMNSLLNPGPSTYYNPDFRNVFEDHLNFILNNKRQSIRVESVDENTAARFAGDWRGLMLTMGVLPHMTWYNMRINGYTHSAEFNGDRTSFQILDIVEVEKLVNQFNTRKKN